MTDRIRLGRGGLEVPRLGVGAMTWGSPSGRSRWGPAKLAYGGTPGPEEERRAFEASLSAGVDLFDTAAMYSGGASERRLGELAEGKRVVIATKFPPGWLSGTESFGDALDQSLVRLRRLQRRWPCGGSWNGRRFCRSQVRRTGGRRPAMPKRCPSRLLAQRRTRSIERRRRGGGEVEHARKEALSRAAPDRFDRPAVVAS
jgi:Aldo/keto reductase family